MTASNTTKAKFLVELAPVFATDELMQPREKLFRYDSPQSRYYFRFPTPETEIPYLGATGAVDKLTPGSEALTRWYAKNGETAYLMARIAADYGSLMHVCIGDFERNGRYVDWRELEEYAFRAAMDTGYQFAAHEWGFHLPRNLASWIQFCEDSEVQVLAVEYPVWSDRYSIATLCDIYCEMTFNRKRVRAIINLKKGYLDAAKEDESKQFYETHDLQLQIEKALWSECVPGVPVDMVFNWSPNNWTKAPTYTLKNWTDTTKYSPETLDKMLQMIKVIPGNFAPPQKTAVMGGVYNGTGSVKDNVKFIRIKQ